MRIRRIIVFFSLAVVTAAMLSACGTKAKVTVPPNAIAVVGDQVVLRSEFDYYLAQAKTYYAQAHKTFPAIGSTAYESIRSSIVTPLVMTAAIDQQAANMGVKVTDAQVNASLQRVIKQRFKGSRAKYLAELRKEHLTEEQLKEGFRQNLISAAVETKLFQSVRVSNGEIKKYYDEHESTYQTGESRAVSHILVKTRAEAESIYRQLKAGAKFATLAKMYGTDSTKANGGSLGVMAKSKLVPAFAKVAFALKTGTFSPPVHTQFGWHIILATGSVIPAHTETLAEAAPAIEQTLLQQKQAAAVTDWVNQAKKYAADNTTYAAGYEPPTSTSSAVATSTTS